LFLGGVGWLSGENDGKRQDTAGGQRDARNVSWMDGGIHEW